MRFKALMLANVQDFLDEQVADVKTECLSYIDLLREKNIELKGTRFTDTIGGGIHELIISYKGNEYRILYYYLKNQIILLLVAFHKKTRKTPRDIKEKAKRYLKEFKESQVKTCKK